MVVSWTRGVLLILFVICLIVGIIVEVPAQKAVALATATVLLATFYLYKPKSPPLAFERLPPEDFTVWVDSGEPFSRIVGMSNDLKSAATMARQDLNDLGQNLELLVKRLEIMEGKGVGVSGLKEAAREIIERIWVLSREFPEFPGRALEKKDFLLNTLENCSINLRYISEKLMEMLNRTPPEISTSLALLQTRSNKLAEDFQKAKSHLASLLEKIKPPSPEVVSPVVPLLELKPIEAQPVERPSETKPEEKPQEPTSQQTSAPESSPESQTSG